MGRNRQEQESTTRTLLDTTRQSWPPSAAPAQSGRRSTGRLPWAFLALSLGACLAALSIGLFIASMNSSRSPRIEYEQDIPADGIPSHAELLGEHHYSLYSEAENMSCTITGPSGAPIDLTPPAENPRGATRKESDSWLTSQPERLSFATQHNGDHQITCTATAPIILNFTRDTSENNRQAHSLFLWSGFTLALSAPLILGGAMGTIVQRSRQHRDAELRIIQATGPQQWDWPSGAGPVRATAMGPAAHPPAAAVQAVPVPSAPPLPSSVYSSSPAPPIAPSRLFPTYPASPPVFPESPNAPGALAQGNNVLPANYRSHLPSPSDAEKRLWTDG